MMRNALLSGVVGALLVTLACESRAPQSEAAVIECPEDATLIVEALGSRMRGVSLLGPDSVVRGELTIAYSDLVSEDLMREWQGAPANAPGREVSIPWPARI